LYRKNTVFFYVKTARINVIFRFKKGEVYIILSLKSTILKFEELPLPLLILITLLLFIKAKRKFSFKFFVIFSLYLFVNFLIELSSNIIAYHNLSNIILYNIAILIEGTVFLYLFYHLHFNKAIKKSLVISALFFILFWNFNFFFMQRNNYFDTYTYLLSCVFLSTFSLITIYQFVFEDMFDNPFNNFFFWVSIGILFCYLGNIPYLMFFNILFKSRIATMSLNIISQIVNTILYIMIITGILCHQPSAKFSADKD
jgi:hypothetical protein